jgi:DNA-binding IclR family transcriptional regulator
MLLHQLTRLGKFRVRRQQTRASGVAVHLFRWLAGERVSPYIDRCCANGQSSPASATLCHAREDALERGQEIDQGMFLSNDVVDAGLGSGVPAVNRAMGVLAEVAAAGQPVSLSAIASRLGIAKSTAHGICHTLARNGYLRKEDLGFVIGPAVMTLAHAFTRRTMLATEFGRMWAELDEPPEDTVVMGLLSGVSVMYAGLRLGARPVGIDFREGMQLPAFATACGKALLAWRAPLEVRDLLDRVPPAHRNFRSVDDVLDELTLVRRHGWSIDDEGIRAGVVSFGAPVFDREGAVVAGIAMCVHKAFAPDNEVFANRIMALAATLARRLGGSAFVRRAA